MKRTLSKEEFCDWYAKYRPNSFSYEGRIALFDMLESFEESTDEELEFDPIAFCCDFTEYEDMEEFWKNYDKEDYPDEESIMNATTYWHFGGKSKSFIIQNF